MNVKISQKHNNLYYIRKNYTLKSIYDDENECINYMLSGYFNIQERSLKKGSHVASIWKFIESMRPSMFEGV